VADVWMGDTMGEMPAYYAAARVALLGGSFEPLGGQNLIEAAACACPLVMGPHTFNFADAAELSEAAGAAVRVQTFAEAMPVVAELLRPERHDPMAAQALHFAASHRGAAQRMAQALVLLKSH
jgi:3-deoxy-D-manno-octulosonic-acid transferase